MIFCKLHSIFPSPEEARKNTNNKQNAHLYHVLEYQIKDLITGYISNIVPFSSILDPSFQNTASIVWESYQSHKAHMNDETNTNKAISMFSEVCLFS